MTLNRSARYRRLLPAAALLFCITALQAAGGFNVKPEQEAMVKVGMTMVEVEQALGRPARKIKYGNEPGPTWSYNVLGNMAPMTVFEVNFSADGKVSSVDRRVLPELDGGAEAN